MRIRILFSLQEKKNAFGKWSGNIFTSMPVCLLRECCIVEQQPSDCERENWIYLWIAGRTLTSDTYELDNKFLARSNWFVLGVVTSRLYSKTNRSRGVWRSANRVGLFPPSSVPLPLWRIRNDGRWQSGFCWPRSVIPSVGAVDSILTHSFATLPYYTRHIVIVMCSLNPPDDEQK